MVEFDPRTRTAIFRLKSGAVVKIREDEKGGLEIRETTHRYLNVKPMARNTLYLELEDPMLEHPRLIEFDLPVRQTADLAETQPVYTVWEVPMRPRNVGGDFDVVLVSASSAEEALSRAISIKPGHSWGKAYNTGDFPTTKENQ